MVIRRKFGAKYLRENKGIYPYPITQNIFSACVVLYCKGVLGTRFCFNTKLPAFNISTIVLPCCWNFSSSGTFIFVVCVVWFSLSDLMLAASALSSMPHLMLGILFLLMTMKATREKNHKVTPASSVRFWFSCTESTTFCSHFVRYVSISHTECKALWDSAYRQPTPLC